LVDEYSIERTVKIFAKWFLICAISAAPSFVLGLMVGGVNLAAIAGMVFGVLVFVVAYTAVEHHSFVRKKMKKLAYRRTAWIGYGTRLAMSIIFPVGFYLDMICGLVSVSVSQWLLQVFALQEGDIMRSSDNGNFISSFVMTIMQGICVNIVLFGYLGLVFGIVFWVVGDRDSFTEPVGQKDKVENQAEHKNEADNVA